MASLKLHEENNVWTQTSRNDVISQAAEVEKLTHDNLEVLTRLVTDPQDLDEKKIMLFKVLLIHARTNTLLNLSLYSFWRRKFHSIPFYLFRLNVLMNIPANEDLQSDNTDNELCVK